MIRNIIAYSMQNKLLVLLAVVGLIAGGIYAAKHISLDAVPDITNNQVQIVTNAPALAAEEIEQYITQPLEMALANIPHKQEIRSISRYGLSVITVVFDDDLDPLRARQYVSEQLAIAKDYIPQNMGTPELMPITTGLGEIYQYVLKVKPGYEKKYSAMDLRTIQDWIVRRQLMGTPGVIEVNSFGGYIKQYEVSVQPMLMAAVDVTLSEVAMALEKNNANSGGSYIESGRHAFYIRSEGRAANEQDIGNIVIRSAPSPIRIKDVATVSLGSPKRYGAMTMDGRGEIVGGITLMLKGANSYATVQEVKRRIATIAQNLPEGVTLLPYLDRSALVAKTIDTVSHNLLEGGAIVILVLILFLGNWRAGLVVASVIPLSMFVALICMQVFDVSANLMSLGAIDFGIVVDGAVIIAEGVLTILFVEYKGKQLNQQTIDEVVIKATNQLYSSASFGMLIILVVLVPVYALEGIEGKTFLPMVQTVSFAIIGALLLAITYVPVAVSLILKKQVDAHEHITEKGLHKLQQWYKPLVSWSVRHPLVIVTTVALLFVASVYTVSHLGAEFIPTLEEGDLAMQMTVPPGSSLQHSINTSTQAEKILLQNFPEVKHVVSKIGTAEIPTDPMAIEDADIMIILKDKAEWVTAQSREALVNAMKTKLEAIPNAAFEFSQPIQLRFNELMTGAKTDIAVQIFGEDMALLKKLADQAGQIIRQIDGAGDVKVEQTEGLRQLSIHIDRQKLALYGVQADDVNQTIRAAYAGMATGVIFENERRFDLVVRLAEPYRNQLDLNTLMVRNQNGQLIPVAQVAQLVETTMPMQISREDAKRRITVGINVRNTDVASLVARIQDALQKKLVLPPGYTIKYGGQYENLQHALERLSIMLPVVITLIMVLLYMAFHQFRYVWMILLTVPMSSIGGIWALWLRDMPFSISAGIGFIALFGVATLNGIVLMAEMNRIRAGNPNMPVAEVAIEAALHRLRPVLMTSTVATLGFLPMAISTTNGAEVQRPLATVVIGGLITSTLLTLLVLPAVYAWFERNRPAQAPLTTTALLIGFLLLQTTESSAQTTYYNLKSLQQAAINNRMEVRMAELEKKFWNTEKQYAYTLNPAQLDLQQGQNDGPEVDYFYTFTQDFGVPWSIKLKKKWANTGILIADEKQKLAAAQVQYGVASAFYQYLYYHTAAKLLQQLQPGINAAVEIAANQQQKGAISLVDYLAVKQLAATLRQQYWSHQSGKLAALQNIRYLAAIPGAEVADTTYHLLNMPARANLNRQLLAPAFIQVQQYSDKAAYIKKSYLPGFYAGAFTQSLGNTRGYWGIKAGVNVPIVATGRQKALQLNKIEQSQAELEAKNRELMLETELENAYISCIQLQQLNTPALTTTEQLTLATEQLRNRLVKGDINQLDFARLMAIIVEGALNELSLSHQYNQAILKYEFLTKAF